MTTSDFSHKMRVAYIPTHAHSDLSHKDVEYGFVSSINTKFVFVKFDKQLENLDWNDITSHACEPNDLIKINQ